MRIGAIERRACCSCAVRSDWDDPRLSASSDSEHFLRHWPRFGLAQIVLLGVSKR